MHVKKKHFNKPRELTDMVARNRHMAKKKPRRKGRVGGFSYQKGK